ACGPVPETGRAFRRNPSCQSCAVRPLFPRPRVLMILEQLCDPGILLEAQNLIRIHPEFLGYLAVRPALPDQCRYDVGHRHYTVHAPGSVVPDSGRHAIPERPPIGTDERNREIPAHTLPHALALLANSVPV